MSKVLINKDPKIINQIVGKVLLRTNMPIPNTFKRGQRISNKPTSIIVHDTNCLNHTNSVLKIDSPKTGMGALKMDNVVKNNFKDINYHYILDRLGDDYEIICGRPINMRCEHDDIDKRYADSIHVIILSDLNVDVPKTRVYNILAYRCLAPVMKMLKIGSDPKSVIQFHDDLMIKNENNISCPGEFLSREMLISQTRRYL